MTSVTSDALPALFRAADQSSDDAQHRYLGLVKADLFLIVTGALLTAIAVDSEHRTLLAVIGATALVGGLVLTVLILQLKMDKIWFGARAVAESVKTIAWRYMTGAEPYAIRLDPSEADQRFQRELLAILSERRGLGAALGGLEATGDQITETMRNVRASKLEVRKERFVEDRIKNQRRWYAGKSGGNRRSARHWLFAVAIVQGLAAVFAVALVAYPTMRVNLAAVFATIAAVFVAWLQVKQHQELSHAYALASQELGVIEIKARHIVDEDEFASFVSDAENAISREHTMWVARRDVV